MKSQNYKYSLSGTFEVPIITSLLKKLGLMRLYLYSWYIIFDYVSTTVIIPTGIVMVNRTTFLNNR